jgi:hypothetical protein
MAPWFGVRALGGFTTLLACGPTGADLRALASVNRV